MRQIVVSSVISFVFRTGSCVFKSEETGRSGTSDVPILRADPDITPLPIYALGEVSSEKISFFFKLKLSQEISTSSPEMWSLKAGLFGQRDW